MSGPRRPNIVVILADDLGYGDVSCQNADDLVPTPHFDRLTSEGVRFSDAHSPSAVCTPTRYGLLTGRYCWRTSLTRGVLWGYSAPLIEPGRLTLPQLLKSQGYATAAFGKWHLGLGWQRPTGGDEADVDFSLPIAHGPTSVGFDEYFGIPASLDMPPYCYIRNDRLETLPTDRIEDSPPSRFLPRWSHCPGLHHGRRHAASHPGSRRVR